MLTSEMAYSLLESKIHAALQTYSNVHRGSGQFSAVTTHLFEKARTIVLEYLDLDRKKYHVIFCSPGRCSSYQSQLEPQDYQVVCGEDFNLHLGVCAFAVRKNQLHRIVAFQPGGGAAKLISREWVLWSGAPDKFEAGTPAIISIIALTSALSIIKKHGKDIFGISGTELTVKDILYDDNDLGSLSGKDLLEKIKTTIIGRGVEVPTIDGGKTYVNFDNSASTLTFSSVWDAYRKTLRQPGHVQKAVIDEAREICAGFLNASKGSYDIIFTSGTTESVNVFTQNMPKQEGMVILSSILEHSSNDLPWRMIPGAEVIRVRSDNDGFIDFNDLERLLKEYNLENRHAGKKITLVALSGASNVLGSCNDICEAGRIVHKYGARLFIDGAQLVAHSKVDLECNDIDYFAFSAHKIYAPFGTGVLAVKKGSEGFTPDKIEELSASGEKNAAGIAALARSLVILQKTGMDVVAQEERALSVKLLQGLLSIKDITVYGLQDPDSPLFARKVGVFSFTAKGIMADKIARELAKRGIGIRAGCHCAHVLVKHLIGFKPALENVQKLIVLSFPNLQLPGIARASIGIGNTEEDVERFVSALKEITAKVKTPDIRSRIREFSESVENKIFSE